MIKWPVPPCNTTALSVDVSFLDEDGTAAAGIILQRYDGTLISSAYRYLFNCNDAMEAGIHALMIGMALARQYTQQPV